MAVASSTVPVEHDDGCVSCVLSTRGGKLQQNSWPDPWPPVRLGPVPALLQRWWWFTLRQRQWFAFEGVWRETWKIPHLHSSPSICWAKWSSPSYQWDTFTPLKALTLKKLYLQSKNNIMQDLHKCFMSCSVKVYLASRSNHLCPANLIKSCVPATFKGKEGQWRRWQKVCVRRRVHIDHTWQTHFHRIQCSSCHFLHYSEVSIIINCMIIYSLNTSCMRYVAEILT